MRSLRKRLLPLLCAGWLCLQAQGALAQQVCRGDIDDDEVVGPDDLAAVAVVLFAGEGEIDGATQMRAEANNDGGVTAADVTAITVLQGFICPPKPSRTPTATSAPTQTATISPTITSTWTPMPTPTPTQVCSMQQGVLGVIDGALAETDCRRVFRGSARLTDVYSLATSSGQALRVDVEATGGAGAYPPFVRVVDSNGFFDEVDGTPPIEFTATSSLPYLIFVTSDPTQEQQTGSYRMTLSSRACLIRDLLPGRLRSFDGSECPDPTSPTVDGRSDLADMYTFTIDEPLSRVEITMRQSREDSLLDPVIAVYGPDGYELFPSFQADDAAPGGFGFDAQARFLALQTGVYTLIASGGGCDPTKPNANCGYRLTFSRPTACTTTPAGTIPSTSRKVIAGTLYGDTRRTACPAPVMVPGFNEEGEPELNSASDVYTFTAEAGDVISAEMDSDGDPQLTLFGPQQSGNPFITQNDAVQSGFTSQLAATLAQPGTYTLFAVNRTPLEPPDPNDPEDPGDFVEYEAFLQKCPASGGLVASTGRPINARFRINDCVGFGGYPFQTYVVDGNAGEVISTTMSSTAVNASIRVLGADGSVTESDDDALAATSNARAIRTLAASGTYFVETSTSREDFEPELGPAPAFTVAARSCASIPMVSGTHPETFSDADCDLGGGRKYDVYTLDGVADLPARPFVVSVEPPANGCALGLLPEGSQHFLEECTKDVLDIPVVGQGTAGFVIAADSAADRGVYTVRVQTCALPTVGFGSAQSASLASAGCSDATGVRADWVLFRDRADLVRFNDGLSLALDTAFASAATVADARSRVPFGQGHRLDAADLMRMGGDLAALVRIQGVTANDRGSYTLRVMPPVRRQ